MHDLRFPYHSSLLIGIVPPNHSAFLSRDQNSFSARKIPQNGRRAKIIVGTNILRTILRRIFHAATRKPRVVLRVLMRPQNFSGGHVQRHDGVSCGRGWGLVSVTSADIKGVALDVNGGRIPHRAAVGRPDRYSLGSFSGSFRRFRNGICFPDLFSRIRVQRYDAATKCAAGIHRTDASGTLFSRRNWNVESVLIKCGSASDARKRMILHLNFPELLAGLGIKHINVCSHVAKRNSLLG